jgi:hypothetical protein
MLPGITQCSAVRAEAAAAACSPVLTCERFESRQSFSTGPFGFSGLSVFAFGTAFWNLN